MKKQTKTVQSSIVKSVLRPSLLGLSVGLWAMSASLIYLVKVVSSKEDQSRMDVPFSDQRLLGPISWYQSLLRQKS